jgi:hypothetical protein
MFHEGETGSGEICHLQIHDLLSYRMVEYDIKLWKQFAPIRPEFFCPKARVHAASWGKDKIPLFLATPLAEDFAFTHVDSVDARLITQGDIERNLTADPVKSLRRLGYQFCPEGKGVKIEEAPLVYCTVSNDTHLDSGTPVPLNLP